MRLRSSLVYPLTVLVLRTVGMYAKTSDRTSHRCGMEGFGQRIVGGLVRVVSASVTRRVRETDVRRGGGPRSDRHGGRGGREWEGAHRPRAAEHRPRIRIEGACWHSQCASPLAPVLAPALSPHQRTSPTRSRVCGLRVRALVRLMSSRLHRRIQRYR